MAGEKNRIFRQRHQFLRQAVVHLLGIAAGKIHSAAGVDKHRVARNHPPVDQEALRARRVAGGVHELDLDAADVDLVAVIGLDHIGRYQAF